MFDTTEKLAIEGGEPAVQTPIPPRKRHGETEKRYLDEVIDSDILFFFIGTKVKKLERRFADLYGKKHCLGCSSGTAAMHIAVGSLELPPGTEVITSAITDMGSLTGLLYQGLVPVFADVEADTMNMDPASVRAVMSSRTGAILAVHHSGLAANLDSLLEIGTAHGIPVIEDCAQAYGCKWNGELVGRRGVISAFSLNHFKHISAGSGGMVLTDDDHLRYIASLFLDKCYQREEGIRNPFFLAPNYQMTEMQGAVALAQLDRLEEFLCGQDSAWGPAVGASARNGRDFASAHRTRIYTFLFSVSLPNRPGAFWMLGCRILRGVAVGKCASESQSDYRRPPGLPLRCFSEAFCVPEFPLSFPVARYGN